VWSAAQEFAAAEAALRPPGATGCMVAEVEAGELKLVAALLQANTGRPSTLCFAALNVVPLHKLACRGYLQNCHLQPC
jgi:hypothetical protein